MLFVWKIYRFVSTLFVNVIISFVAYFSIADKTSYSANGSLS